MPDGIENEAAEAENAAETHPLNMCTTRLRCTRTTSLKRVDHAVQPLREYSNVYVIAPVIRAILLFGRLRLQVRTPLVL